MKKNKIFDAAGIFLLAVSVIFLFHRITAMRVDFTRLLTPSNTVLMVSMPFFAVMVIFSNSYCWKMNLQMLSKKHIPVGDALQAYARANIMKYLPGNVGHYAGRQLFGSRMGIRQTELAVASVLEIIYNALSLALCSFIFFSQIADADLQEWYSGETSVWIGAALFALLIFAGLAVYVCRRNRYMVVICKLLERDKFWRTFFSSVLICSFGTFIFAMEYIALFGQYCILDFQGIILLLAANYTAVFIGFVTPGVPGGIGVREAVLIKILSPFFPEDNVILAAVSQRLIMILGDLLAVPVSRLFITTSHSRIEQGGRRKAAGRYHSDSVGESDKSRKLHLPADRQAGQSDGSLWHKR